VLLCPLFIFFFHYYAHHRDLHSFPTRRSSDLASFEHRVNARTPVDLAVLQEDLLDLGFEPGIFSLVLAHFPLAPGIIAADRNVESLAQQRHRVLLAVFGNELKPHAWLREKMPIAFFNISRSCRNRST